jgi:hypothetical protein
MNKKRTSRRIVKIAEIKQGRLELDKAVKALNALKNQPQRMQNVRTHISQNTVVVKVQVSDSELRGVRSSARKGTTSEPSSYVDQSVKDTLRES